MFECHLTFDMKDAETVRAYGGDKRMWKYSQIDGDPVLGDNVFCYLSAHDNDFTSMRMRMDSMTRDLYDFAGVSPIRRKIEIIVYDVRDGWRQEEKPESVCAACKKHKASCPEHGAR